MHSIPHNRCAHAYTSGMHANTVTVVRCVSAVRKIVYRTTMLINLPVLKNSFYDKQHVSIREELL